MTRPGFVCWTCPDAVKAARSCPKPRKSEGRFPIGTEPTCPVLDIPPWWWSMLDAGKEIDRGILRPSEVDAWTWETARATVAAVDEAARARAEHEAKVKEMKRKAFSEVP